MKKKSGVLVCTMVLVLGLAGVTSAAVWAPGVTETTGWIDTNKTGTDDSLLCWAAAASNILAYTGWSGAPDLSTAPQIFSDYKNLFSDGTGTPNPAVAWWFYGQPGWDEYDAGTAVRTDTTPPTQTGFYSEALFDANSYYYYYLTPSAMATELAGGVGAIRIYDPDNESGTAHWVTLWGVDATTGYVWITDSDQGAGTLDKWMISADGLRLTDYKYKGNDTGDWNVTWFFELDMKGTGDPAPIARGGVINPPVDPNTPVPEPGTMVLLGSGLVGLVGWGRRKIKK